MSLVIHRSDIWWGHFTRVAERNPDFQQFHIKVSDFNHYKKHLHNELARNNGMFFFAVEDDLQEPVAATAISFEGNVLRVHFYWSSKNVRSAVFRKVNEYCLANNKQVDYVQYPQRYELHDIEANKYARITVDEDGRLILWYKFSYNNFFRSIHVLKQRKDRINEPMKVGSR